MRSAATPGSLGSPNKPEQAAARSWTYDEIAEALQQLRAQAGNPSYGEIVVRIATDRKANGASDSAARPARTTVYDCFRLGRSRVNARLVGEIVAALTRDVALSSVWVERCATAQSAHQLGGEQNAAPAAPVRSTIRFRAWVMAASVSLNLGLIWIFAGPPLGWLKLPVFLDMIGTAISAIALGPWYGVAVGVITNVGEVPMVGVSSIPFALVQVAGALIWGYGARKLGFGRDLTRYFVLHLLVALASTALAAPILVFFFPDDGGNNSQILLITRIHQVVDSFGASVFSGNLFYSVIDKLISGFAALPALTAINARYPIPGLGVLPQANAGPLARTRTLE